MANTPVSSPKPSAGAGRSWPILFPLIVFGVILFLATLIVCSGGFMMVTGTQFHPDGFRIRRFVALRVPVIGIQAGGTSYTDETPRISQLLVDRGWITKAPLQSAESEWELIEINGGWQGLPLNLTDYLQDGASRVNLYEWSEKNPLLAGMLWSEIATAAKLKLYWMTPELIDKMIDFSRVNPVNKSLSKDARAKMAQQDLTAYLLESYQQTEAGAKATGDAELAAACRKQVERLSTAGVVILKETAKTEPKKDGSKTTEVKAQPQEEKAEDAADSEASEDASN
ncbi:hypothetical protein [Blastopirellula marina]|uniref:Uncharacterized protein n=1 Tax=Blastopirellula marina TaxID=124 RepID=A0A2S8GTE3_9BACT|nr:hypothetical protein [Blastopirellula marina]PQO47651.1 hypothetical protein C5Y93_03055 [Blastopirellula marina]